MKKIFQLTAYLFFILNYSIGQTNTFPLTGNVGVGTTNPIGNLDLGTGPGGLGSTFLLYGSGGTAGYISGMGINLGQLPNSMSFFIGKNANFSIDVANVSEAYPYVNGYTSKFTMLNNGNVGIGTTTPSSKLNIVSGSGYAYFLNDVTGVGSLMGFGGINGPNLQIVSYTPSVGDLKTQLAINYAVRSDDGYTKYAIKGSKKSPVIELDAENGSVSIFGESGSGGDYRSPDLNLGVYVASSGNVGIGTQNPYYKLDVLAPGGGGLKITASNSNIATPLLDYYDNARLVDVILSSNTGTSGAGDNGGVFGTYSNHPLYFAPNKTVAMTILQNGNVAIGTTDPRGYKLAVNGDAIFTKVKVKQYVGWPDYVFENTHYLLPLADLECFIKKYKHLPGILSAKELEKEGLDLGESQATLLKKIEELTLYIIDQNKRLEKLEKDASARKPKNKGTPGVVN